MPWMYIATHCMAQLGPKGNFYNDNASCCWVGKLPMCSMTVTHFCWVVLGLRRSADISAGRIVLYDWVGWVLFCADNCMNVSQVFYITKTFIFICTWIQHLNVLLVVSFHLMVIVLSITHYLSTQHRVIPFLYSGSIMSCDICVAPSFTELNSLHISLWLSKSCYDWPLSIPRQSTSLRIIHTRILNCSNTCSTSLHFRTN